MRPPPYATTRTQWGICFGSTSRSVAVVTGLVRAIDGEVKVRSLVLGKNSELDAELLEVSASDFLVELLGENVDTDGELARIRPKGNLRQDLVGEGARHNERRVTGGATVNIGQSPRRFEHQSDTYPKFTRRPSAKRMMWRPLAIV